MSYAFDEGFRTLTDALVDIRDTPLDVAELFGPDQGGTNILVEVNSVAKGKDTDPKDKHFATILYTRRVPAAEFAKDLSPADKTLLFPEGMLESMIATEAEQAAAGFGPKSLSWTENRFRTGLRPRSRFCATLTLNP